MLLKNPDYSNNKYYNDLLILSKVTPRLTELPCIGVLIKDDGSIIQSKLFCTYSQDQALIYQLILSGILGSDTLFPNIVSHIDYLKGWDKFLQIQRDDAKERTNKFITGCGESGTEVTIVPGGSAGF